jgi:glycine C-acetyltransferase
MYDHAKAIFDQTLNEIREAGLFKEERVITTPQRAEIATEAGTVINFCANNYLGLADNVSIGEAAKSSIDEYGFGMASVRFICGTQTLHKKLEAAVAKFIGTEDCILYASCFDANGGLFETLLTDQDAIISDQLNHASIIDGVRLCKAKRFRYLNSDMNDLEAKLKEASDCRIKLIATDGVFSMDGYIANLKDICDLADKYGAMVMIDDCHASGFIGENGRGTPEHCGVEGRIDIITSTFGKALGGATGGFTASKKEVVELLRQRSRPYLFSNALAPNVAAATLRVLAILSETANLREKLRENTKFFREQMTAAGFDIRKGVHPICPVMLGDAKLAQAMASDMLKEGIYVIGFSYPVVPKDQARIRVQLSAAHERQHLEKAVDAFTRVGKKHGVIS